MTWPGYEFAVANTPPKIYKLLAILFEDLEQTQAHLGVRYREGDSETYTIDRKQWVDVPHHREDLADHIAGIFSIHGVRFADLGTAERFLSHMEQRLAWYRLGGRWA